MEIPNNCRECECDKTCKGAHYGSLGCKYKEQIAEKAREERNIESN